MRATDSQGTSLDIEATTQHQHLGNECWTTYSTEEYYFFFGYIVGEGKVVFEPQTSGTTKGVTSTGLTLHLNPYCIEQYM